jgi:hypothetical protein
MLKIMFGINEQEKQLFRVEGFILKPRKGDAKYTKRHVSTIVEATTEVRANVEAMYVLGKQLLITKTTLI